MYAKVIILPNADGKDVTERSLAGPAAGSNVRLPQPDLPHGVVLRQGLGEPLLPDGALSLDLGPRGARPRTARRSGGVTSLAV